VLAAFVLDAIFLCRAVAHQHVARRGNRSADSNSPPSIRRNRVASAIGAAVSAGRGKLSDRANARRLCADVISASLLSRPPLGEAGEQADHMHEQVPHQHVHYPGDAVPGAARVEPKAQFSSQDIETLGRV